MARDVLVVALCGDHGTVVAAELQFRQVDLGPQLLGTVVHQLAQTAVCGHTARQTHLLCTGVGGGQQQFFGQDSRNALLKAGGKVRHVDRLALHLGLVHLVEHGGFQAGEAHVVLALHMGHRQTVGLGVAGLGGVGHTRPAGVGQTQGAGHLVKGFSGGIVHRVAQNVVVGVVLHLHDVAVPAGGHQAEERRLQLRVGQVERGNVAPQVVHRHQRLARRVGQPLGKVHAHQHRADEARRKGDGHGVHVVHGLAGVQQGLFDGGADELTVAAAGDLRHHAAVQGLFFHAGGDDVAQQMPAVLHQSCGGLVAGGFDS